MAAAALLAILLAIAAGAFSGTALLPMKYARSWKFENTWLLYSIIAYLISPWIVALATVPQLGEVYSAAGLKACVLTALFGIPWGVAVVLNGIGVATVGLSLALAIIMGSSVAVGSLGPLLLKEPGALLTHAGLTIALWDLVMLSGVLLCAWAGELRGRAQFQKAETRKVTTRGILICLIAGLLSTFFNLVLSYGEIISKEATARGASPFNGANAVWSLAVSAGSLPSILWCVARLARAHEWSLFGQGEPLKNSGLCLLMGAMWITGTVLYGAAARMLGPIGPAVGWPIYMSGSILTSSFWGWTTGEWRGTQGRPVNFMLAGIAVQIAAVVALGRSQ
jgi:L-rhamnose-H+ transport protein